MAPNDKCPTRPEPTYVAMADPSKRKSHHLTSLRDRLSYTQGLVVGQLSVVLLHAAFIKFFIFGDPPSPEATASQRATERRSRTLALKKSLLSFLTSIPRTEKKQQQQQQQQQQQPQQHHPVLNKMKSSILRPSPP